MGDMKLGEFLMSLRQRSGFTLRQVEEATGKRVSNAYLSQIEKGKIAQPSPNILFALSEIYSVPYDELMEMAGYISARGSLQSNKESAVVTNSLGPMSKDEEQQLLKYLAFLRSTGGKKG